jgi:serine protease Do
MQRIQIRDAHKGLRRTALAAVLLGGTALGGYAAGHGALAAVTGSQPVNSSAVNPPTAQPQQQIPSFVDLVKQVKPAVVSVTTKFATRDAADDGPQQTPQQLPFPFNQMPFGQMMPHGGGGGEGQAVEARGSGFIIDANGTIVTNNHVVNHAKSVSVTLADGTELTAKVIGRDPRTDIAVLKIEAGHKLPYVDLGNSTGVEPGEWVVAMGNPFGLGGSVTAGIVSALGRDIGEGPYDQFIQIDAPINPGNSGGPLFSQDGKVIGMNTAIFSPSHGGSVGIGFAIPSNSIKTVVAQLETSGHVTRGYIGVQAQPVSATMEKAMGLADQSGALVAGVQSDTPAAHAGLQPGDVIRSVDGTKIDSPHDLAVQIAGVKPGDATKLDIVRGGKTQTISVTVGELPNEQTADAGSSTPHPAQLGLALGPITPEAREQLNLPQDTHGVLVENVRQGSPADQAGLQQGDVIVAVGDHAVENPGQAVHDIHAAVTGSGHAVALRIIRDGQPAFVAVTPEQPNEG